MANLRRYIAPRLITDKSRDYLDFLKKKHEDNNGVLTDEEAAEFSILGLMELSAIQAFELDTERNQARFYHGENLKLIQKIQERDHKISEVERELRGGAGSW